MKQIVMYLDDDFVVVDKHDEIKELEDISNIGDNINLQKKTELGESLHELNKDKVDENTKMSSMDMRANLHPIQLQAVAVWDSLIAMGFLPDESISITRQVKRLSPSKNGKGREQIVETVTGHRKNKNGMAKFMSGMFGGNDGGKDENGGN